VQVKRKFEMLIVMDPEHVKEADSVALVSIVKDCQEHSAGDHEWLAVRDRIVDPTIHNFLYVSRMERVKSRARTGTAGIYMCRFLTLKEVPKDAPNGVMDVATVYQDCMANKHITLGAKPSTTGTGTGSMKDDKNKRIKALEAKNQKMQSELDKSKHALQRERNTGSPPPGGGKKTAPSPGDKPMQVSKLKDDFEAILTEHGVEDLCLQHTAFMIAPKGPHWKTGALSCDKSCGGKTHIDGKKGQPLTQAETLYGAECIAALRTLIEPKAGKPGGKRKRKATPTRGGE
jgi:hypothetical protein